MVSMLGAYSAHPCISQDPRQECCTGFPTRHKPLVCLHPSVQNGSMTLYVSLTAALPNGTL